MKQRKLVQWALAYLAGAWLILEVSDVVGSRFGWPDSLYRGLIVVLVVGLLAALVLAWYHGEKGRQRLGGVELLLLAGLFAIGGAAVAFVGPDTPRLSEEGPGVWTVASLSPEAVERRLGVLPLANLSAGRDEDEYLVDGLHEEIRSQVAKIRGLDVPARTSLMRFKDRAGRGLGEIAAELGVRHVLDGSVRRAGNSIRVSVQLVDARSRTERWSQAYDREFGAAALFEIQSDIALQIARALEVELTLAERTSIERPGTDSDEAYQLYLRGLSEWLKEQSPHFENANALFQEAVRVDPGFAKAWSGLGGTYVGMGNYWVMRPEDAFPRAREAILKAIELDGELAHAHAMLAWVHYSFEHDWPEAGRLMNRALELNPGEAEANELHAYWLQTMGRFDEAVLAGQKVLELDPLSGPMYRVTGRMLYFARRYEEAIETFRRGRTVDPTDVALPQYLAFAYTKLGLHAEAVREMQVALRLGDLGDPEALAEAYQAGGIEGAWSWWLNTDVAQGRAGTRAALHAQLGHTEEALEALELAYEARDSWLFQLNDPFFDSIRDDPRFAALRRRLNLPESQLP
ncbi:MAG: hypothetical protein OEU54_13915 [Gemmatimonadota bacterium]|nr:hypothetical protein [Gemmatimonadota bacterium]